MFRSVKTRTVVTFLIVVILTIAFATVAAFQIVRTQEHALNDNKGLEAAETCATTVYLMMEDSESFKPGESDYEECRQALRELCKNTDMTYMYAYHLDRNTGTSTYLIAAAADDEHDALIMRERPYGTVVESEPNEVELAALDGNPSERAIEYNNMFGHMIDWVAPVDTNQQILAAASYSISDQRSGVFMSTAIVVGPFIFALLVLLFVQLFTLQRYVMKPLNVISQRMMSFSAEHARSFEPIDIKSRDELGAISQAFNNVVVEIGNYLEDIETMTAAKVQSDVELNIAKRIQQGMVPATTSVAGEHADVFAFSRPAREIGGDLYDIVERDDGTLSIIIADVSGKGMAAALFMAMSKEMIRFELSSGKGPAEALRAVNEHLCQRNPEYMFITVFIATLKTDGRVVFANAGHLPPVRVLENAELVPCKSGCLLGLFDDAEIEDEYLQLAPGETLLLYTDGACEAVNEKREFLGDEAIVQALQQNAPFASANDVIDGLVGVVDGFAAQVEQFDDFTAIAMMRHGGAAQSAAVPQQPSLTQLDVSLSSFDAVKRDILNGEEKEVRMQACLACEEAFVNIVMYSEANSIHYNVREEDGMLVVVLQDDGVPFDPLMSQPVEKDFDELDSGGMGISLVKSIASDLSYQRSAGHNTLTLSFCLKPPHQE